MIHHVKEYVIHLWKVLLPQRLRNRGGICPPWNFKIQVILPNFAPP